MKKLIINGIITIRMNTTKKTVDLKDSFLMFPIIQPMKKNKELIRTTIRMKYNKNGWNTLIL